MKELSVGNGLVSFVDNEDYDQLSKHIWHVNNHGYVVRNIKNPKTNRQDRALLIHRHLLGLDFGDKRKVDHIDRNPLNNCRHNLRIATDFQNSCNRSMQSNNSSGFKGVSWDASRGKWLARCGFAGKKINLGRFSTPEEAYKAYCEAAEKLHGEYAHLPIPA